MKRRIIIDPTRQKKTREQETITDFLYLLRDLGIKSAAIPAVISWNEVMDSIAQEAVEIMDGISTDKEI